VTETFDSGFDDLAQISDELRQEYVSQGRGVDWTGSPFAWIRPRASRQKGAIGQEMFSRVCEAEGIPVEPCPDPDANRIVSGVRAEIKFSMLWASGHYVFQQFRRQDYDLAVCLGVSPSHAHCWVIPRDILDEYVIGKRPQHTGAPGTETFWLWVKAERPEDWLASLGGTIHEAVQVLKALVGPS